MASVSSNVAARVQLRARGPTSQQQQRGALKTVVARPTARRVARPSSHREPVLAATLEEESVTTGNAEMDVKSLYAEFAELLDQYDHNFKRGDMVTGRIFKVDARGAYVDIGAKSPGYCVSSECSISPSAKANDVLQVNTQREFLIVKDNARDGEIALSLKQMELNVAWQRMRQIAQESVTLQGKVISLNRGGVLITVENLNGFVPSSHLSQDFTGEKALGKIIPIKVLEVDEQCQRLVCSNRMAYMDMTEKDFKARLCST